MERLKNRVAIVTGGARGIGKAAAELFCQEGATVIIWDVLEIGEETASILRGQGYACTFQKVSTTDVENIENAVQDIIAKYGQIDILINNAGITRDKTLLKMSHSEWQQVIDVNLTGVFNCTKAVVPHMCERKYGRIICASSINGVHGAFGQTNYAAAKAGLIGMCRSWAKELGKFNITANAVAPGFIATDMTNEIPEEMRLAAVAQIPVKRMGLPIDIANAYLFLASEEASFISGQVLGVNGGWLCKCLKIRKQNYTSLTNFNEMIKQIISIFLILFAIQTNGYSQIKLPRLISDGMVLQRDKPLKIWGWASPNEAISLDFNKKTYKTKANTEGYWTISLPAQKAGGGAFEMTFSQRDSNGKSNNEVKIKDILFGDVWFCSGQSNMVHQMQHHDVTYARDISEANNANIRQFLVPTLTNLKGTNDDFPANTAWKVCNPENVREFSAVAYFFAKKTYEKYQIPIGIINASVGGTPIEAWMSEEGFKDFDKLQATIQKNKDTVYINGFNRRSSDNFTLPPVQDKGLNGAKTWFDVTYTPKGWKPINVPGYFEDQGIKDLNGIVWYRKEIDVPATMIGKPAKVFLGRIVDADVLYINGKQVGATTYMYPQRRYNVPADLLKTGKNIFVVKVTNNSGKGGFVPDKPYCLFAEKDTVDLKGTWQYKVGEVFMPPNFGGFGGGFSAQNSPTALYNAMVAPAINFALKGILWYQGESNSGRAEEYVKLQPAQIMDWRNKWKQADLPFLYVQLPNFMDANYLPSESQWAEFREAQLKALSVSNTAMAVGIDLGEWNDIHPDNKKTVGERLAIAAQKLAYGENIVASGPLFQSATIEKDKIMLSFDHIGSGLKAIDDEDLREFAIAGIDKKFVWATAKIVGDKIEVFNKNIVSPMYVRYAWADNPDVNLYNKEGLPASPFTTETHTFDPNKTWQGKKCAVVLTYDDALNVHLDNAIPILDSLQFKGSFYLSGAFDGCKKRLKDWRKAAENGHELGNHTLFHPCDGSKSGRSWLTAERDMSKYSVQRMTDEIKATNVLLEAIDGKKKRTFAYTCGDMTIGNVNFMDSLKNDFVAARAVRHEMHSLPEVDLYNVDCYAINGETGEQMIDLVKKSMESGKLLVFLFHGVGGEHGLNVDLKAHRELLYFLKNNEKDVWVAPMIEVAEHIKKQQKK